MGAGEAIQCLGNMPGQSKSPPSEREGGGFGVTAYSAEIAPMGQVPSQAPQSMQAPASMTMCSSPMEIAPTGQEDSQAPQETQASPILRAM